MRDGVGVATLMMDREDSIDASEWEDEAIGEEGEVKCGRANMDPFSRT